MPATPVKADCVKVAQNIRLKTADISHPVHQRKPERLIGQKIISQLLNSLRFVCYQLLFLDNPDHHLTFTLDMDDRDTGSRISGGGGRWGGGTCIRYFTYLTHRGDSIELALNGGNAINEG